MEENFVQTVKNCQAFSPWAPKKSGIKWRLAFQDYILIWLSVLDHVLFPPAPMEFPTKNVNFMLYDFLGCVGNFETYAFKNGIVIQIWVLPKIGVPQSGWFRMENPIKMDDFGVPEFSETPI